MERKETGLGTVSYEEYLKDMHSLDYEDKTLGRCASCLHISAGCQTDGREIRSS